MKQAYDIHFAATIERAEKQIILARHGRRILNLLDDTPIIPGDARPAFEHVDQARQILNDAEEDLREWEPNLEPIPSSAEGLGHNLMPAESSTVGGSSVAGTETAASHEDSTLSNQPTLGERRHLQQAVQPEHSRYAESELTAA